MFYSLCYLVFLFFLYFRCGGRRYAFHFFLFLILFALTSLLSAFSRTGKLSSLFRSLFTFNYLHLDVGFQWPSVTRKINFFSLHENTNNHFDTDTVLNTK